MISIEQITQKFYKTENERLSKIEKNQVFISDFIRKNFDYIMDLYNRGIRLYIFDFNSDTINAGLFLCCGNRIEITQEIRLEAEKVFRAMDFVNIIWEN